MLKAKIDYKTIDFVLLTHFHSDHISELRPFIHALDWTPNFNRKNDLILIGPVGFKAFYEKTINSKPRPNTYQLKIKEMRKNLALGGFKIECVKTVHSEESVAYKFTEKANSIIKRELKNYIKKLENNESLRGKIASLGIARGKVQIVIPGGITILKNQGKNLTNKYVLVTPMTQPNMIPYIKHAVAIVTDEGGLTSHTAIIAREFKIPCIVGTEIATKIFKNGDLIEVDANKGIVKILRRAK